MYCIWFFTFSLCVIQRESPLPRQSSWPPTATVNLASGWLSVDLEVIGSLCYCSIPQEKIRELRRGLLYSRHPQIYTFLGFQKSAIRGCWQQVSECEIQILPLLVKNSSARLALKFAWRPNLYQKICKLYIDLKMWTSFMTKRTKKIPKTSYSKKNITLMNIIE